MLLAAPVLVGAALPLLRPLHRKQQIERGRNSDLTSMATDIVAGLRILRGIGGERTFGHNYDRQSQLAREAGVGAGMWQAAIEAVGVLFSGVFIVLLVWLGSRQVISGDLEIGQLISFLGYALFMIYPIQTFFELAQKTTRAMVSPGRRSRSSRSSLLARPGGEHAAAAARRPLRRGHGLRCARR